MPFVFKGNDLSAKLGDPLSAADSIYGLLGANCASLRTDLIKHWQDFRGNKKASEYASVEKPFADVEGWWSTKYGDAQVVKALYKADAASTRKVLGYRDADDFMERFNTARENAFYVFFQILSVNKLISLSFRATYLHKDIEHIFLQHDHGTDVEVLSLRVAETARIMLRIL